jgi:hypothetical protein
VRQRVCQRPIQRCETVADSWSFTDGRRGKETLAAGAAAELKPPGHFEIRFVVNGREQTQLVKLGSVYKFVIGSDGLLSLCLVIPADFDE